jgi:radical SAM superfamily enzyme YgiQ (UPF0313 family)
MSRPFRLTLVYPSVGRRHGSRGYLRAWQMEPLAMAVLAALVPPGVECRLHDDRLEPIPYDQPTDLVALSVETYTARRAYQIASAYRRRGVPVVMGGFHPTLAPDEVERYAESVVVGNAEPVMAELIDDARHGRLRRRYTAPRMAPAPVRPDRSIFAGRRYLPVRLIETSRGCRHRCDFCAVAAYYGGRHRVIDLDLVRAELEAVRAEAPGRLLFFVDDNVSADREAFRALLEILAGTRLQWVGQASLDLAADEQTLAMMRSSGCRAILVGIESLEPENLRQMAKGVNLGGPSPGQALAAFRRHRIPVYGTFTFGYDHDTARLVDETVRFAVRQGLHLAAFNHITPFPGTPLLERLERSGQMRFERWWLDPGYRYGSVPFEPRGINATTLARCCAAARRRFFGWSSILRRATIRPNASSLRVLADFVAVNAMHRGDTATRYAMPLGDETEADALVEVVR